MNLRGLLAPTAWLIASAAMAQDNAAGRPPLAGSPAAVGAVQRGVQAGRGMAELRFQQGVTLMEGQRDAEALAVFERLAQDFPELPEPHNNIALLHARAGRLDAALGALQTALRNDPAHGAARRNLGDVHLLLALQAWEQAAATLPADGVLQRRLRLGRELMSPAR